MGRLDDLGLIFITLRRRSPQLRKEIALLPRSAWRTVELEVPTRKYRFPRAVEQPVELVKDHTFRQMFIEDLGHEDPTILLTNDRRGAAAVITRYAQPMLIEDALSDGGRKRTVEKDPTLPADFEGLVEPTAAGDPMSPLRWTTQSVRPLATGLQAMGLRNWRGQPLVSLAVIVNLIAATRTATGLRVRCELDRGLYPKGHDVSGEQLAKLNLEPHRFHGDWNDRSARLTSPDEFAQLCPDDSLTG